MNPTPTDKGRRLNVFYDASCDRTSNICCVRQRCRINALSYKRYLENQIRDAFGFEGTPIHIIPRKEINQQRGFKDDKRLAVFGMGSFGTALANVLAQNGHDVCNVG